jgi:kinesin family member 11
MPGSQRQAPGKTTRRTVVRQPSRLGSLMADRAQSPADAMRSANASLLRGQNSPGVQSTTSTKRKERDYEPTATTDDTNIYVVVRCRGRSEREIKENSGVVVATEGVKGKSVELSMGPNAVSNKTYHFDKVFSPAADQAIMYEEVVMPILSEVCYPV